MNDDPQEILSRWYTEHYSEVTASADGSVFATYMHRAMERRFGPERHFPRVLEVGGNRGENVPFVRHGFDDYLLTDLFPPRPLPEVAADPRVHTETCDVTDLPVPDASVDRVISTCLLHHVDSPLLAVNEMRRVTRPGGVLTVLVPTDPGLAYRVGKALTSGRAARRAGIAQEHRLIAAIDHRNHFGSIRVQLEHACREDRVEVDWRPWRVPGFTVNAFVVFHITRASE